MSKSDSTIRSVNRTLSVTIQKLMDDLKRADARIRELEAELVHERRARDVEMGR
jgi:hypothetical protein